MTYQVKIQAFEGPFDLLLHLIRENEVDIYDIPIAEITAQYLAYLEAMEELDLEITSDFLVMAATLLAIKARMLLPPIIGAEEQEGENLDVRGELVRDILEYLQFKEAANGLNQIRQEETLHFFRPNEEELYLNLFSDENPLDGKTLADLSAAFAKVLAKASKGETVIQIEREQVTVQDKLVELMAMVAKKTEGVAFGDVFAENCSRAELIVTFLALLELARRAKLRIAQHDLYGEIYFYPA
ncbi:MAG: segregation/condensation protein A [Clostridiales bacterium]